MPPAEATRSTLQLYFLALDLVAAAVLGLPEVEAVVLAACSAALAAGLVAGAPVARHVPDTAARRRTLALAGAGGPAVLLRAAT